MWWSKIANPSVISSCPDPDVVQGPVERDVPEYPLNGRHRNPCLVGKAAERPPQDVPRDPDGGPDGLSWTRQLSIGDRAAHRIEALVGSLPSGPVDKYRPSHGVHRDRPMLPAEPALPVDRHCGPRQRQAQIARPQTADLALAQPVEALEHDPYSSSPRGFAVQRQHLDAVDPCPSVHEPRRETPDGILPVRERIVRPAEETAECAELRLQCPRPPLPAALDCPEVLSRHVGRPLRNWGAGPRAVPRESDEVPTVADQIPLAQFALPTSIRDASSEQRVGRALSLLGVHARRVKSNSERFRVYDLSAVEDGGIIETSMPQWDPTVGPDREPAAFVPPVGSFSRAPDSSSENPPREPTEPAGSDD
jgi:hypothetical protein